MKKHIMLSIEGDYIDSYLYSGALFIIHANGKLSTYRWQDIIEGCFSGRFVDIETIKGVFFDSRKLHKSLLNENITLSIEKKEIEKYKLCEIDLDVWPTDIDMTKNDLFISSEYGAEVLPCQWDNGRVRDFGDKYNIWSDKVFQLSVGFNGRTLLAAGLNGAIEVFYNGSKRRASKEVIINEGTWLGCEWSLNSSFAVLNGINEQEFLSFPTPNWEERENYQKQEWQAMVKNIVHSSPEIKNIRPSNLEIIKSWVDDSGFYIADSNFNTYIYDNEKKEWNILERSKNEKETIDSEDIIKSRGFDFGFLVEDTESLHLIDSFDSYKLADQPVSWRVFPKAKSYRNHVHVIMDDMLNIYGFTME